MRRGDTLSQRTLGHKADICLTSHIVPVLPRILSGNVYSLGTKRSHLTLSYVVAISPGNRIVSRRVTRAIVQMSGHVDCANMSGILTRRPRTLGRSRSFIPVVRGVRRLSAVLERQQNGENSVSFSFPRAGVRLSRGKGPVGVGPCREGDTAGVVRSFVLLTGRAITRRCF